MMSSAECQVPSAECRVPSVECQVPSAKVEGGGLFKIIENGEGFIMPAHAQFQGPEIKSSA